MEDGDLFAALHVYTTLSAEYEILV